MKPTKIIQSVILTIGVLALTACGSSDESDFAKQLKNQGAYTQKIGDQWSQGDGMTREGKQLITKGRKQVSKGRSIVSDGEDQIEKGEEIIANGNAMKERALEDYKRHMETVGVNPVNPAAAPQQ